MSGRQNTTAHGRIARAEAARAKLLAASNVPEGLCQCGCGASTNISRQSDPRYGAVAGKPSMYLRGHGRRVTAEAYVVEPGTGCWVWQRHVGKQGYGYAWDQANRRGLLAHRVYYERYVGPIPRGYHVHHHCTNRRCVNPDHLEAVTKEENQRQRVGVLNRDQIQIARQYLLSFPVHDAPARL